MFQERHCIGAQTSAQDHHPADWIKLFLRMQIRTDRQEQSTLQKKGTYLEPSAYSINIPGHNFEGRHPADKIDEVDIRLLLKD